MNMTKKITFTAVFGAIAAIIMFFEFPLPFMPPFLKVDLSGAVILIGAYIFGIGPAITMTLIKDMIHLFVSTTGGSGELADFLMTSTLVVVAYFIFSKRQTQKSAILGCTCGTIAMSLMGMLTNRFIIIPFYAMLMPIDSIIQACAEVNPYIGSLNGYLIFGVLPFNLIKGIFLSVLAIMIYQKLGAFIRASQFSFLQRPQE